MPPVGWDGRFSTTGFLRESDAISQSVYATMLFG
jgi:hypothetical protein